MLLSASTKRLRKDFSGNSDTLLEQEISRKIKEKININLLTDMSINPQSCIYSKLVSEFLDVYYFLTIK